MRFNRGDRVRLTGESWGNSDVDVSVGDIVTIEDEATFIVGPTFTVDGTTYFIYEDSCDDFSAELVTKYGENLSRPKWMEDWRVDDGEDIVQRAVDDDDDDDDDDELDDEFVDLISPLSTEEILINVLLSVVNQMDNNDPEDSIRSYIIGAIHGAGYEFEE